MATTEITYDDVDSSVTEGVQKVQIALDGQAVELDLGEANRTKLQEFLTPFIQAGRPLATASQPVVEKVARPARKVATPKNGVEKVAKSTPAAGPKITTDRAAMAAENEKIRAWAGEQGIELNPRGRIPNEVKQQFYTATSGLALVG